MTVPGLMKWKDLQLSQVMIALLFGTNMILAALFKYLSHIESRESSRNMVGGSSEDGVELLERGSDGSIVAHGDTTSSDNAVTKTSTSKAVVQHNTKHTKPFIGTLECYTTLTTEVFRLSLIMAFTYICERHWFYEHSGKEYSRDHFLFILLLFFLYAFYTIKPIKDTSVLGREQTEEWKGWMQFIFLLY